MSWSLAPVAAPALALLAPGCFGATAQVERTTAIVQVERIPPSELPAALIEVERVTLRLADGQVLSYDDAAVVGSTDGVRVVTADFGGAREGALPVDFPLATVRELELRRRVETTPVGVSTRIASPIGAILGVTASLILIPFFIVAVAQ